MSRSSTGSPDDTAERDGAGPERAWPFVVLGLGLFAVGVAAWRPVPAGVWHDDGVYMLVAKALAEGQGLVYAGVVDNPPAAKFPPLYPMLLAGLWWVFGSIGPVTLSAGFLNLAFLATAGALFARALTASTDLGLRASLAVAGLAFASSDVLRPALIPLSEGLFLALLAGTLTLWPRIREEEPGKALPICATLLVALVATRTAGLAMVLATMLALALGRRLSAAVLVGGPALAFAAGWSWWTGRASAAIPEGARDLLGPYAGWIVDQTLSAPGAFLGGLPRHALGIVERAVAMTFPGITGPAIWVLAIVVAPLAALGLFRLVRRFPPLGWFGLVYLAVLLVWPYLDRRLLVPWHPVMLTALTLGGLELARHVEQERPRRMLAGLAVIWIVAYTSVTAGRIADGWPTEAYRLRSDRLAAAVEALARTAPEDAIIGAPEYWAALHLHGGWSVAPSVRFDPRRSDPGEPVWGTPEEQIALWRALGVDHLLLEQNGTLHEAALDRLEEACAGSVLVLARMSSAMVVRVDTDPACEEA